ncbi:MAG: hypothetical protein EOP05_23605, partial [Proteobacteria bacterium]
MRLIKTSELQDSLPHRAPMVWVDEVGETSELGGESFVTLKGEGLYFSEAGLRPSSLIEFLAQGFGFQAAAHIMRSGLPPAAQKQKAFLVSVTQANFHEVGTEGSHAKPGDRLHIVINNVKHV